ncbi:DUF2199 domain-containing protein [Cellulomonas sp. KRMCY2]|uniref:DUF2199 domain-containing protein n=1 Tax=Cellulomonas sp. KRMCY2 TaxID=1304865 RepID=UPI0012DCB6D9|nr:DUF2199 domain-containing protein [Cellulomonas sp. KRMCY2]
MRLWSRGRRRCPCCGAALHVADRHERFTLPDPALEPGPWHDAEDWWMNDGDARTSVFMQVPGLGSFVRALLPVQLGRSHKLTFGVWIGVTPDDLKRASEVWWEPEYAELVIDGRLANALPPDIEVGAPVRLVVRDPEHTPYCDSSTDPRLQSLLTSTWAAVDGDPVRPVG